jgi:hypothetical protein
LKRPVRDRRPVELGSPPTRGRGLKRPADPAARRAGNVAPHAGAWIETGDGAATGIMGCVAPHAGAWIETQKRAQSLIAYDVAPHAGAWIETA